MSLHALPQFIRSLWVVHKGLSFFMGLFLMYSHTVIGAGSRVPGGAQAPLNFFQTPWTISVPPWQLKKLCIECDGINARNVHT